MSKNAKTILIILGIFAVLAGICVVGFGFLIYRFADTAKIEESEKKGTEFGRTTDNFGCQTESVSTVKKMGQLDITGSMQASFFFKSCLKASRKSANFCDNVPSDLSDKLNDDKWKDGECEKKRNEAAASAVPLDYEKQSRILQRRILIKCRKKPLNQELFDEPYRFEFFQAVRLLEKIFPERMPVGREAKITPEIVRFRSRVTLNFPASEIHEFKEHFDEFSEQQRFEMFVNFMGVIGVSGVLPVHYTELVMDRIRYGDTAMWSFLDMFTHRAVSLFYRAWEKYRFPVQYERGKDDFTCYLFDFAGLGTKGLRGRMALDDESLLPFCGLIAQKPHSATALVQILSDYFGIKSRIEQFFGQWLDLEPESVTQLGAKNSLLGRSALIGTRVWEQQSKFRLILGALSFKQFQAFLPNGTAHEPMKSIVKFMVGLEFDFDVQLILLAKQVPGTVLTTRAQRRPMLGWTSFLKTKPFKQDDDQLILRIQ